MKRWFFLLCGLLLLGPLSTKALEVSGSSAILMDMDSGRVLYEKNADDQRLIASITKIMTATLAIESGKLDDIVTVGEEVLTMYGSNIYLELHEKMSLRNLVYGLMLRSGNDAAIVIATYLGGTEEKFVEQMNQKADQLGMKNTIFHNAHGLDEVTQNYSTARDMAILSSYAYKLPEYQKITGTKKYILKSEDKTYLWYNRNKLLTSYEYATGGKTGYTPSAGRTLVTNAIKDDFKLTAVTLNDPDKYTSHKNMYEYGFTIYQNYRIINKDNFGIDPNFYPYNIYVKDSFYYPLSDKELSSVKTIVKLEKQKGVRQNEEVGWVEIYLKDKILKKVPVYAMGDKVKTSWWKKVLHFITFGWYK